MLLDFINQLFMIALGIFVFVFIVLGDRLGAVYAIMQVLAPFGFFGLFFLIKLRISREGVRKMKLDGKLDEILFCLSEGDMRRDFLAIFSISLLLSLIPVFFGKINSLDIIQSLLVFSVLLFTHKVILKKGTGSVEEQYLTRLDEIIDGLVVFVLPIIVYALSFFASSADNIDIVQTIFTLLLGYAWHYFYFRLDDKKI